jgi:hypothetical protein
MTAGSKQDSRIPRRCRRSRENYVEDNDCLMFAFSISGEEIGSARVRHVRHYVTRLDAMKVYDITTLQNSLIVKVRKDLGIDGNYSPREISTLEGDRAAPHEHHFISTDGNIGNDAGEDFWSAARIIVEQVYITLRPGGHVCWVVKDFVKKGQVVPFCDQWRRLCEAVGFETLHEHHAELIRHNGTSHTLDGEEVKHLKSSKSFFRRVAESHGSPAIDFEVVYCMVKPMGDGSTQQGSA